MSGSAGARCASSLTRASSTFGLRPWASKRKGRPEAQNISYALSTLACSPSSTRCAIGRFRAGGGCIKTSLGTIFPISAPTMCGCFIGLAGRTFSKCQSAHWHACKLGNGILKHVANAEISFSLRSKGDHSFGFLYFEGGNHIPQVVSLGSLDRNLHIVLDLKDLLAAC